MTILVCGSRDYASREAIRRELAQFPAGTRLVHGGCGMKGWLNPAPRSVPVSFFGLPPCSALPALTATIVRIESVFRRKRVAADTMSNPRRAASYILTIRNRLKVVGVNAAPIEAKVIKNQIFRDWLPK